MNEALVNIDNCMMLQAFSYTRLTRRNWVKVGFSREMLMKKWW